MVVVILSDESSSWSTNLLGFKGNNVVLLSMGCCWDATNVGTRQVVVIQANQRMLLLITRVVYCILGNDGDDDDDDESERLSKFVRLSKRRRAACVV